MGSSKLRPSTHALKHALNAVSIASSELFFFLLKQINLGAGITRKDACSGHSPPWLSPSRFPRERGADTAGCGAPRKDLGATGLKGEAGRTVQTGLPDRTLRWWAVSWEEEGEGWQGWVRTSGMGKPEEKGGAAWTRRRQELPSREGPGAPWAPLAAVGGQDSVAPGASALAAAKRHSVLRRSRRAPASSSAGSVA